ncbi:hypothetical protein [Methylobacterium sp. E-046]|uniref:hypothetical protein n=1 Tax=Methylobacterium sp. E-046 TaxID=2836576 RepID=UPI001FBBBAD2|nr:hypothetical protein [Methylobacterium sp. E-046]MCJ2099058.1 hypothetical protein [Methylobacterium sp. E-046]
MLMRFFLVSVLLINMVGESRADDLADLPELACALASTPLERQQIGCPGYTSLTTVQPAEDAVRFEQSDDAAID